MLRLFRLWQAPFQIFHRLSLVTTKQRMQASEPAEEEVEEQRFRQQPQPQTPEAVAAGKQQARVHHATAPTGQEPGAVAEA